MGWQGWVNGKHPQTQIKLINISLPGRHTNLLLRGDVIFCLRKLCSAFMTASYSILLYWREVGGLVLALVVACWGRIEGSHKLGKFALAQFFIGYFSHGTWLFIHLAGRAVYFHHVPAHAHTHTHTASTANLIATEHRQYQHHVQVPVCTNTKLLVQPTLYNTLSNSPNPI